MAEVLVVISLCLKIFTVYFVLVAVFALKKYRPYPKTAPVTRFAVLVAARNEETVIGNLVHSVLTQDYPSQLRDVYVVPNNCTDFTETVARAAGAKIIRCQGAVRGKGEALHNAFEQMKNSGYDAFVVLDADNTIAPDYLARLNDAVAAGARVFKSKTRAANPTAGAVAGCYGLYNTCFDVIWNRPRAACGLSAKVIGTGFGFTADYLEEIGSWNTSTIAEDAEFAAQCARRGERVWWVPDAVNYDEEPLDFSSSLRQRKRWCSGVMQVARQELPRLWGGRSKNTLLRWDMTMFLLAAYHQAVSGLTLIAGLLLSVFQGEERALLTLAIGAALYYLGGVLLAPVLCLLGGYRLQGMGKTMLLFPIFMASWLPLQVISLFVDTKKWTPITHTGGQKAVNCRL